jgi:hypothetical protein
MQVRGDTSVLGSPFILYLIAGDCRDRWIYNSLCRQCLSPLSCEFKPCFWRGVLDITLCDKVCQ